MSDSTHATNVRPSGSDVSPHMDAEHQTTTTLQKKSKLRERSFPVFPVGKHSYLEFNSDPRAFYVDKTRFIPHLEGIGAAVILLAPQRFGKSLLLDTLACYYDISRAKMFEEDFGRRWIGQMDEFEHNGTKEMRPRKTEMANKFYVLRLDFSCFRASSFKEFTQSFNGLINVALVLFCDLNPEIGIVLKKHGGLSQPIHKDAMNSFVILCNYLEAKRMPLMLLIDEYDSILNSVIGNEEFARDPEELKKIERTFKRFFAIVKSRLVHNLRVYIAGVTPIVLSINTGGFNVGYNNLQDDLCRNLFGFTESDVNGGLKLLSLDPDAHQAVFAFMKELHNGYRFHKTSPDTLFNPTCAQFVLSQVNNFMQMNPKCSIDQLKIAVREAFDFNSRPAEPVLHLVSSNPHTLNIVTNCLSNPKGIFSSMTQMVYQLEPSSMVEVDKQGSHSILYWMFFTGALTYAKENETDDTLSFTIPNKVAREEFIDEFLKFGPSNACDKLQEALSYLLDSTSPSIDPFLQLIELYALGGTKGHNIFDNEDALQSLIHSSFILCARPGDTVESEQVTKPFHANSKDGKTVDLILYLSLSGSKKRFVFELKSVPVSMWLGVYQKNLPWSKKVEIAQDAARMSDDELLLLSWHPDDQRIDSVQTTLDEAATQLKGYLTDMKKNNATEGPVIGFVIVRVGLYRLISKKVS